jgi:hypothetical protein
MKLSRIALLADSGRLQERHWSPPFMSIGCAQWHPSQAPGPLGHPVGSAESVHGNWDLAVTNTQSLKQMVSQTV